MESLKDAHEETLSKKRNCVSLDAVSSIQDYENENEKNNSFSQSDRQDLRLVLSFTYMTLESRLVNLW